MVYWKKLSGSICLLALASLISCGGSDEPEQSAAGGGRGGRGRGRSNQAALPVKVEPVRRQDISEYILVNTTLEAERWVDVRARRSGQVVSLLKEEGDSVSKGSLIARLDADDAQLDVNQRQVAYDDANRMFEREKLMFERNFSSEEQFENRKSGLDKSRTELEQAKLNLSYTSITSPIGGVMTLRNIEVGNMVTNNQVIGSVANFNPLLARIQVTEKNFGKITLMILLR